MTTINLTDLINSNYPAFNGGTIPNAVNITDVTAANSTTTGALKVSGGVGVQGSIYATQLYANNVKVTTPTRGQATLDFGVYPGTNEATVTVTGQTDILTTSVVNVQVHHTDTSTSHTAADHEYFSTFAGITVSTPTASSGFTIKAKSLHKLTGTWTVRWSWV